MPPTREERRLIAQCQAFVAEVTRLQQQYPVIYATIAALHYKHRIPLPLVIQIIEHDHHDDFYFIQRTYLPQCLRLSRNDPLFCYSTR